MSKGLLRDIWEDSKPEIIFSLVLIALCIAGVVLITRDTSRKRERFVNACVGEGHKLEYCQAVADMMPQWWRGL